MKKKDKLRELTPALIGRYAAVLREQEKAPALGKGGAAYGRHSGFCLEPQYFPDAVHHPEFEQNLLLPAKPQRHVTTWRFSVE